MLVRYLPLILAVGAAVPVLAPTNTAAQEFTLGAGQRTDGTPSDREAENGVFDHKRKPAAPGHAPKIELGEVQAAPPRVAGLRPEDVAARYVTEVTPYSTDPPPKTAAPESVAPRTKTPEANPADKQARPKTGGAPVDSSSQNKALPPGTDARQVRPAQAFPPERIEPGRIERDDPRSVEESKDPGG
jgi:hypothetical protein